MRYLILLLMMGCGATPTEPADQQKPPNPVRVVVVPFDVQPAHPNWRVALADSVATQLATQPDLVVLEHAHAEQIWKEYELQARGLLDDAAPLEVGCGLQLDVYVRGRLIAVSGEWQLMVRINEAHGGASLDGVITRGPEPFALVDEVASALIPKLRALRRASHLAAHTAHCASRVERQ